MSKEERNIIYRFVPSYISDAWTDDEGMLSFIECSDLIEYKAQPDEILAEILIEKKADGEELMMNMPFEPGELLRSVESIKRGDYSEVNTISRNIAAFASSLFYTGKLSPARVMEIHEKTRNITNTADYNEEMMRIIDAPRSTDEIIKLFHKASFMAPYMYDLKTAAVEAPGGTPFVMGYGPMTFFNFIEDNYAVNTESEFIDNGIIIFITVSPYHAVCLYDSYCYKPKLTGGRVLLSDEDVTAFNRYRAAKMSSIIYYPTEEKSADYYINLMRDVYEKNEDTHSFNIPAFRMLAHAYNMQEIATRLFPGILEMYDASREDENSREREEQIEEFLSEYRET